MSLDITQPAEDEWEDIPDPNDSQGEVRIGGGNQILPIGELPDDFDGNPVDGSQYLAMMKIMYDDLPFITTAPRPPPAQGHQPVYSLSQHNFVPTNAATRHPALPKESWEVSFTAHFAGYKKATMQTARLATTEDKLLGGSEAFWRGYVHGAKRKKTHKSKLPGYVSNGHENAEAGGSGSGVGQGKESEVQHAAPVSEMIDEEEAMANGWALETDIGVEEEWLGEAEEDEDEIAVEGEAGVDGEEDDDEEGSEAGSDQFVLEPELEKHKSHEPLTSVLQVQIQRTIYRALKFFNEWISEALEHAKSSGGLIGTQPSSTTATSTSAPNRSPVTLPFPTLYSRWIFSLLLFLELELTPDQMSDIRTLARTCIDVVRWQVESGKLSGESVDQQQEDMRIGCWMTVYAISSYWGQKDLVQDAERMFARLPRD